MNHFDKQSRQLLIIKQMVEKCLLLASDARFYFILLQNEYLWIM